MRKLSSTGADSELFVLYFQWAVPLPLMDLGMAAAFSISRAGHRVVVIEKSDGKARVRRQLLGLTSSNELFQSYGSVVSASVPWIPPFILWRHCAGRPRTCPGLSNRGLCKTSWTEWRALQSVSMLIDHPCQHWTVCRIHLEAETGVLLGALTQGILGEIKKDAVHGFAIFPVCLMDPERAEPLHYHSD